ncbi:MAG: D-glycerate dehydrogenase [Anaerolineales bacterium]
MASQPKIFVTRLIPEEGLALLRAACQVDVWEGELPPPRQALLARLRGVDGVLSLLTDRMDAEAMDAAGAQLRVISNYAVGYDNVDVPAATTRGIPVGNTPGILTETTADFAFALLMAAARRVVEADAYVRAGHWQTWGPKLLLGVDVYGATLGLVGFGRIGQAVARRAHGFGMRILYFDPHLPPESAPADCTPVELDTLLRESDFISLHTPLTEQTRHLMDAAAFAKMKPSAVLVNTARGPIVDPQALYEALASRRIFAAGLDVSEPEPLPADSPLLELDNLLIAPHIASGSRATRGKMAQIAAQNLLAGLRGERLPHCVNPQVYPD